MLTQVEIDGVNVTADLISYSFEDTYGDSLPEITLRFVRRIKDKVTLSAGLTLEVWQGYVTATDEKIFSGYVEKHELEGGIVELTGITKLWDMVRSEVNHTYDSTIDASAGVISEIFKDLVTTYAGLSADATTIQDSGTTIIYDKFPCLHTDPFERGWALAQILGWQFYYRADTDKVYFEPQGFTNNSTVLTVGNNVIGVPKWQNDITEMANDITFVGAFQEVETTESGRIGTTAGYTTTGITIEYEPVSVKVYGDSSNPPTTLKTGGQPDSSESFDYYVDKNQKKILPASGTTFTTNDYYEIRYSFKAPIPIRLYDQPSIDTYGRFKKTVTLKDVRSVADAEQRGTNHLEKYKTPFVYTTLKVKNTSSVALRSGQRIRIVDNVNSPAKDVTLLINKVRYRYPADYIEIDVGDRYWRLAEFQANVLEKLKRIMEDEYANSEISNELISIDNKSLSPVTNRSSLKSYTQTVSGTDIFILGHSTYGLLGTGHLGDTDLGAAVDHSTHWTENTYVEDFRDDDYKDASTTATWNTTTKELTFTSGQVALTTAFDYGYAWTSFEVIMPNTTGTLLVEISGDGKSTWQTVTLSTVTAFTSSDGAGVHLRITENAASNASVLNTYDAYGRKTAQAIRVKLS